ncbi:hypothetical protein [Lactobacillus sp. ESL0230]|uniref:hypothetical protein n=1 Tax=Lactobacillus sp. ESL0230 TaxID=2069353 RepID=UPI000EFBA6BE|nr:hypothetical protein [Lactobacillus sp. ESL0230]RMC46718.1 hypothetical protein F5ESL0230_05560 [Lactobacillus sp. ESL0230]
MSFEEKLTYWIKTNFKDIVLKENLSCNIENKSKNVYNIVKNDSVFNKESTYYLGYLNSLNNSIAYFDFSLEKFWYINEVSDKVFYTLASINKENSKTLSPILEGLLMYTSQNTDIPLSVLINLGLEKNSEDYDSKDFIEYLSFMQNDDGSIGIINPLKDNNKKKNILEWISRNSIYTYVGVL